jgi:hypothetical protein
MLHSKQSLTKLAEYVGFDVPKGNQTLSAAAKDGGTYSIVRSEWPGTDGKRLYEVTYRPKPGATVEITVPPPPPFRGVRRCSYKGQPGLAYIGPQIEGEVTCDEDGFVLLSDQLQLRGDAMFVSDERRSFFESRTGFDQGVVSARWSFLSAIAAAAPADVAAIEEWVAEHLCRSSNKDPEQTGQPMSI